MTQQVLTPLQFDLAIAHGEVDGIEMGVLGDGVPFLTALGLARACGQTQGAIRRITGRARAPGRTGARRVATLASAYGHRGESLYRDAAIAGERNRVYPDSVCMAVLEYFAFEARCRTAHIARQSFRLLARESLRHYIYSHVGHDERSLTSDSWEYLHHRMALNPLPPDYFSVLGEITRLLMTAIQSGLALGPHTVPDISVGLGWGRVWAERGLDAVYGERCKHPHRYPAGPEKPAEIAAWMYPLGALGEFRAWMRDEYLPTQFPRYLSRKTLDGSLTPLRADSLLAAVNDNCQPVAISG